MKRPKRIGPPPFPLIPQIQKMLYPEYTCDLCQKPISEDQYDHHDGLCPECVATHG